MNGSGSASANAMFAKALFRMGIPVATRNIFPSNIQGLPTWFEVRVNHQGYLGRREGVDIMVAMNAETWANRRRTMVLERLLADEGITKEMIEGYVPTPEEEAEWMAERDRFIGMTLSPLLREGSLPISAAREDD